MRWLVQNQVLEWDPWHRVIIEHGKLPSVPVSQCGCKGTGRNIGKERINTRQESLDGGSEGVSLASSVVQKLQMRQKACTGIKKLEVRSTAFTTCAISGRKDICIYVFVCLLCSYQCYQSFKHIVNTQINIKFVHARQEHIVLPSFLPKLTRKKRFWIVLEVLQ